MKNNKGITLIALVVTIIVLLILAGVSIAMLTGENGILNRASESAEKQALAAAKDEVSLKVNELQTDYYELFYVSGNNTVQKLGNGADGLQAFLESELAKEYPAAGKEVSGCTVKYSNKQITIEYAGSNTTAVAEIDKGAIKSWTWGTK